MKRTGDQFWVKQINKGIVLNTIKRLSPISRAQVSEQTGLNKGTVSNLVSELIQSQLVTEIGQGESSGGRKPVMLLFNQQAGYAIGVDLGVHAVLAVLTDLNGNKVQELTLVPAEKSDEALLHTLIQSIRSLIEQAPKSPYGIVGIGIGVPGIVDEAGTIIDAPNLGWKDVPLKQMISAEFHLHVAVDNEANAGALGELHFGAGQQLASLVYLSVSTGIGAGIILNHELYRGASGFSGEVGHMTININGKACSCGNQGCWELYASEKALLEQAHAIPHLHEQLSRVESATEQLELLMHLAEKNEPDARELFRQIGEYLGVGIISLANAFNPERIIIGNRMADADKWLSPSILKTVEKRLFSYSHQQQNIVFSTLGLHAVALGAGYFAISHFFEDFQVSAEQFATLP